MSPWLQSWGGRADAIDLVCLGEAGAGAAHFRPWQHAAGDGVRVLAVQLPAREERWSEPPVESVQEVVNAVVPALAAELRDTFGVFGHSMGAWLGLEVVRELGARHGRWPAVLVVSGSRPPHLLRPEEAVPLTDDQMRTVLRDRAAQHGIELDAGTLEQLLVPLRGDNALLATHRPAREPRVPCPLVAWSGDADALVTADHLAGWAAYSAAGLSVEIRPGGHLFHREHPEDSARAAAAALAAAVRAGAATGGGPGAR